MWALSGRGSVMLNSTTEMTLMGNLYCREALRSFVVVGANWHRAVRTTLRYFEALLLRYRVFCAMLAFGMSGMRRGSSSDFSLEKGSGGSVAVHTYSGFQRRQTVSRSHSGHDIRKGGE